MRVCERGKERLGLLQVNWIAALLDSTKALLCSLFNSLVPIAFLPFYFHHPDKTLPFRDCRSKDHGSRIVVAALVIDDSPVVV